MIRTSVITFCLIFFVLIQAYPNSITTADSLFQDRKYTESFEIYKSILTEQKKASPSMLLKMAYIKEGLGGYTDALYYLNLYYLKTADKKVLDKMEELASKKNVTGYAFNDFEFLQTVFYKYYNLIISFLLALALLFLSGVYYVKIKKQSNPSLAAVGMVLSLGLLFYVLNFAKDYNRAIIDQSNTFLMTGPSSAAEVIKIIDKGNRIKVLGYEDIWTQVEVDSKIGYIKSDRLREIEL